MILGLFIARGGLQRKRGSGWALLDERRGAFLAVGVLPEYSKRTAVQRWALVANRAAGCDVVAVNDTSGELRAVLAACAPAPRVVEIAAARWTDATMPAVPQHERRDPRMVYAAFEYIARAHIEAHEQLHRLELDQRPAAAAAALIALGVALTAHDVAARVCTEQRHDDPPSRREDASIVRARLELVEYRGEPDYERRVASYAMQLRREQARAATKTTAAAPVPTPDLPGNRRDVIAAKVEINKLEVSPGSPRYKQLVAELVESRRRKRAGATVVAAL